MKEVEMKRELLVGAMVRPRNTASAASAVAVSMMPVRAMQR